MTRILGIDPGSVITGYGVIETEGGASLCEAGCLRLPDAPFPERLARIFDGLRAVIEQWSPEEMAVEDVFVSRNPASALKLGQARGAAICAGAAACPSLNTARRRSSRRSSAAVPPTSGRSSTWCACS